MCFFCHRGHDWLLRTKKTNLVIKNMLKSVFVGQVLGSLPCLILFGPVGISFAERRVPQRGFFNRTVWDELFRLCS